MTDILDTIRLAADTGHAAWREGYEDAKIELARRLHALPKDLAGTDYGVRVLAIVRDFIA